MTSLPTERAIIDHKGRVVIPAPLRRALNIETGDVIELFLQKGYIAMRPLNLGPVKAVCINCGKTEDGVKMHAKSSDGRYGICQPCNKEGFKLTEVRMTK